ncbi:2'-5' RNA ligase family protein [Dyadobacter sp. CY326]|uniref:2'-5' RNA ligase family protein n=1 Tax=Dyadobacter sp. CY326 TaxID=2907300 RepID=UPI001F48F890|nr:2'-5' RNA ligase family protein [Dyadobacter sp. CY326]MCE7067943.1 2'-5' RNA ligase family protein [Dyadobacter sp. CY326]
MKQKPVRYSIVIRPSKRIINEVREMKNALREAIGGLFNSVNSEAHITLFEFHAYEADFVPLLDEYKRVVERLAPLDIKFDGFDHFPKNGAFYVKPTNLSALAIIERCQDFKREISSKLLKDRAEGWTELFGKPHMSIGRKLLPEWISVAYSLFTEFKADFQCNIITIRKFNEERRQFDVIEELPMLGKGLVSDKQLNLF